MGPSANAVSHFFQMVSRVWNVSCQACPTSGSRQVAVVTEGAFAATQ
jgi:hypothetical protein